jgi:hypothetical protein
VHEPVVAERRPPTHVATRGLKTEAPLPYSLAGVGDKTVRRLVDGGFATLEALGAATAEQLAEIPGIGGKTAEKILAAARGDSPAETTGDAAIYRY